jgi:hypothetical protein
MSLNLTKVVIAYGVIGVVMYGGGAVGQEQLGILSVVIDITGDGVVSSGGAVGALQNVLDRIESVAGESGGVGLLAALLAIAGILADLIKWATWPIQVAAYVGMPGEWAALFGGVPVLMFFMTFLKLIRSSI